MRTRALRSAAAETALLVDQQLGGAHKQRKDH